MNILGIGTIFSGGRGVDRFKAALESGSSNVSETISKGRTLHAHRVSLDGITDGAIKKIRRADRISKMSVLAASEAMLSSGIPLSSMERPGIIVASALGAHVTTFEFLDNIIEYGDSRVSPITFSNSVHNASASYVSSVLGIHGPTISITDFAFPFQHALQLAGLWLDEGRCDYVLVGAAEEYGDVLGYACEQKLGSSAGGRITPFGFKNTRCIPGEGSAFFLLGPSPSEGAIAQVSEVSFGHDRSEETPAADLLIIDTDGMSGDESTYLNIIGKHETAASYTSLWGSMMTGSAFHCAAGALMLKEQAYYPNPVSAENSLDIKLLDTSGPAQIESIHCLKCDCSSTHASITLKKPAG